MEIMKSSRPLSISGNCLGKAHFIYAFASTLAMATCVLLSIYAAPVTFGALASALGMPATATSAIALGMLTGFAGSAIAGAILYTYYYFYQKNASNFPQAQISAKNAHPCVPDKIFLPANLDKGPLQRPSDIVPAQRDENTGELSEDFLPGGDEFSPESPQDSLANSIQNSQAESMPNSTQNSHAGPLPNSTGQFIRKYNFNINDILLLDGITHKIQDLHKARFIAMQKEGMLTIEYHTNDYLIKRFDCGIKISAAMFLYLCKNCIQLKSITCMQEFDETAEVVVEKLPKPLMLLSLNSHHLKINAAALEGLSLLRFLFLTGIEINGTIRRLPTSIDRLTLDPSAPIDVELAMLANLQNIKVLTLGSNVTVRENTPLATATLPRLETIVLGCCDPGEKFQQLLQIAPNLTRVTPFNFSWHALPDWLLKLPNVTILDLSKISIAQWSDVAFGCLNNLREIIVHGCRQMHLYHGEALEELKEILGGQTLPTHSAATTDGTIAIKI
jgi:hypothetical protein